MTDIPEYNTNESNCNPSISFRFSSRGGALPLTNNPKTITKRFSQCTLGDTIPSDWNCFFEGAGSIHLSKVGSSIHNNCSTYSFFDDMAVHEIHPSGCHCEPKKITLAPGKVMAMFH